MGLESFLDKRMAVRPGEVAFDDEMRDRVFRFNKGPVVVPKGDIRLMDPYPESRYSVKHSNGWSATMVDEHEMAGDYEVVDSKILGEPGQLYDDKFAILRSPGGKARYERVQRIARRARGVGAIALAVGFGFVAARFSDPGEVFVGQESCKSADNLPHGSYIERHTDTNARDVGKVCELNGVSYVVRELPKTE